MDINNKIKKSHTQVFFSGMWVCWMVLPQLWSNLADKGLDIVYVWGRWGMRGLGLGVVIHVTLYIVHQVLWAFFYNKIGFFMVSSEKIETVLSFFVVEQF